MTAPETCQALTEAGVIVPRREIAQYLRSRKHLGVNRSVDYFEFARAFAAIRYLPFWSKLVYFLLILGTFSVCLQGPHQETQ